MSDDDEANVEETVMLTRRERRRNAVPKDAEIDEATVVVDRSGTARPDTVDDAPAPDDPPASDDAPASDDVLASDDVDDATIVVARSESRAAVVDDAEADDDATIVVARSEPRTDVVGGAAAAEEPADPADDSLFRGPQSPTPAIYRPRPAPLTPSAPPVVIGGAAPTRVADAERTSVAKQARRWSVYTLLGFAAACAVSIAGLVGLGFVVLS